MAALVESGVAIARGIFEEFIVLNFAKYVLPVLGLLSVAGCNNVRPPVEVREDPYGGNQIQIADERLQRALAFGTPRLSRDDAGNLLYVTVPVRNTTSNAIAVEYRVSFVDANGQPLPGSPTTWFPKQLPANVFEQVTVNSVSPRAADFQVDFRYAR